MPAYEYACQSCGEHFERRQKMSEPEVAACPDCGGGVKRLISGGAGVMSRGASVSSAPCGEGMACGVPQGGCGSGCGCVN